MKFFYIIIIYIILLIISLYLINFRLDENKNYILYLIGCFSSISGILLTIIKIIFIKKYNKKLF